MLFKIDLERAFRNLRIDPFDYPLLGLQWQGKRYVDVGLPFGFRMGAAACQMCTDVITHQLRLRNVWVINYLDDYIGVSSPQNASNDFHTLQNLLQKVGLPINQKKVEEPGEQITCLGIEVNARTGILKIPENKMLEVKSICLKWVDRTHASRRQLQKLTGKLLYVHPARLFVNRILGVLCNAPSKGVIKLPQSFFKDIMWFQKFLKYFNGSVEIYPRTMTPQEVTSEAGVRSPHGLKWESW